MAAPAIYAASVLVSAFVLLTSPHTEPAFHETQWYAGAAFLFLYLTLLTGAVAGTTAIRVEAGPRARRALGVSACWFALLHSYFGFYRLVGGLEGLRYWSSYFARSLLAGLLALAVLCALSLMSLPGLVRRMGRSWKPAQRLLYAAAILTLVHVVTVTIHLRHLRAILIVTYALVTPLLMLELLRFDRWVVARHRALPRNLIALLAWPPVAAALFWAFFVLGHHEH